MITAVDYAQKTVAVLGLGRTGLSAARSLLQGGAQVVAWDDNAQNREAAIAAGIPCQDLERRDLADLAALVLSPGIAHTYPKPHHVVELARAVGTPIIGDTELFAMAMNAISQKQRPLVIGITGTNGKSTTTALLTHILRHCDRDAYAGGNIGTACLDLPKPRRGMVYVLELSSYQLELSHTLRCNVAILLNLTPDHLERHGGFDGYVAAKRRIFSNQMSGDAAIVSVDDVHVQSVCMAHRSADTVKTVPISAKGSLSRGVSYAAGNLYASDIGVAEEVVPLAGAPALQGRHNAENAAAAFAAARHIGLSADAIAEAMMSFTGLEHRMEFVQNIHGVRFINDSKATNVHAACQALGAFRTIYWIAGGQAKAGGLKGLEAGLEHVQKAYLIGSAQDAIASQLDGAVRFERCDTLENAVVEAYADARENGLKDPVVLLSPACASFDQFKDFGARGHAFKAAVSALNPQEKKQVPA